MAAAAAASTAAAASGDADDFLRVHRAVSGGASEQELRRVIDECAQGDDRRRKQVVNQAETPLQAAHRQKRGDLVGALVEAGADVGGILFGDNDRKLTPLAVCIAYGQVESVRALLRAGQDANEQIVWDPLRGIGFTPPATHFCLAPPPLGLPSDRVCKITTIGAPQIGCLEVLLREGGADVESRDLCDDMPIHWLARFGSMYDDAEEKAARDLLVSAGARTSGVFGNHGRSPLMMAALFNNTRFARFLIEEAGVPVDERRPRGGQTALLLCGRAGDEMVALLLDAGADVNARDNNGGETSLFASVSLKRIARTRVLLDRGASADVIAEHGRTPLIAACESGHGNWLRDEGWPLFQEILRRSSAETRRSRCNDISAVDYLAAFLGSNVLSSDEEDLRAQKRCCWAISELLASGAPLRPQNAARLLPIASGLSAGQHAEMAACLAELCSWRAHETFVGVSLDFKELRRAEREAEEKRARVASLEREQGELGGGQQETSSSSSDGESDGSSSSGSGSSGDVDDDGGEDSGEGGAEDTEEDAASEDGGEEDGAESESEGAEGAATGGEE